MMTRKLAAAAALTLGLVGGIAATQGVASADPFVPGGIHPSHQACNDAGNAGGVQGRWVGFYCERYDSYGQYLLWVQPTY